MKLSVSSVVLSTAFIQSTVAALPLREAAPSFVNGKHSFGLAYASPPRRQTAVDSTKSQPSPVALNYRSTSYGDDITTQEMYTDRLWQSALVADSIDLELQAVHESLSAKSKDSTEGLIETAKAFIPVAIEMAAVAALAAQVNPLN